MTTREFVGINWLDISNFKQEALIFDKVVIPLFSTFLKANPGLPEHLIADMEWLLEQGILFEPENIGYDDTGEPILVDISRASLEYFYPDTTNYSPDDNENIKRVIWDHLSLYPNMNPVLLYHRPVESLPSFQKAGKDERVC